MAGKVYGVYASKEAVMEALLRLKKEGTEGKDITVIADSRERLEGELFQGVDLLEADSEGDDNPVFESIKAFFGLDDRTGIEETLNALSLSKEEKDAYMERIKEGAFLIAVHVNDELGPDLNDASYEGEDRELSPYNPNINLYRGL